MTCRVFSLCNSCPDPAARSDFPCWPFRPLTQKKFTFLAQHTRSFRAQTVVGIETPYAYPPSVPTTPSPQRQHPPDSLLFCDKVIGTPLPNPFLSNFPCGESKRKKDPPLQSQSSQHDSFSLKDLSPLFYMLLILACIMCLFLHGHLHPSHANFSKPPPAVPSHRCPGTRTLLPASSFPPDRVLVFTFGVFFRVLFRCTMFTFFPQDHSQIRTLCFSSLDTLHPEFDSIANLFHALLLAPKQ